MDTLKVQSLVSAFILIMMVSLGSLHAQVKITDIIEIEDKHLLPSSSEKASQNSLFDGSVMNRSQFTTFEPVQSFFTEYKNPDITRIPTNLQFAGDRNGDGFDDMFVRRNVPDLTTADLTDRVFKTFIYYSNSSQFPAFPDEIINQDLTPIGDLNGDGFSDSMTMNSEDGMTIIFENSEAERSSLQTKTFPALKNTVGSELTHRDFNGDGIEDLVVANAADSLSIIYGAEDIAAITNQKFGLEDPSDTGGSFVFTLSDIDNDDNVEIIFVRSLQDNDNNISVAVESYQFPETGNKLVQISRGETPQVPANSFLRSLLVEDLDQDNFKELIIRTSTDLLLIFDDEGADESELFNFSSPTIMENKRSNTIGDIDGNGRTDFIHDDGGEIKISELSSDFAFENSIIIPSETGVSQSFDIFSRISGDYNGDGNS